MNERKKERNKNKQIEREKERDRKREKRKDKRKKIGYILHNKNIVYKKKKKPTHTDTRIQIPDRRRALHGASRPILIKGNTPSILEECPFFISLEFQ